eukprot:gene4277-777_t
MDTNVPTDPPLDDDVDQPRGPTSSGLSSGSQGGNDGSPRPTRRGSPADGHRQALYTQVGELPPDELAEAQELTLLTMQQALRHRLRWPRILFWIISTATMLLYVACMVSLRPPFVSEFSGARQPPPSAHSTPPAISLPTARCPAS